jgi:hypothetical protein
MTSQDCTASAADFAATGGFITDLFCRVDDAMRGVPRHSQAKLFPSEVVTLGLLFALRGQGERAFYRWIAGNLRGAFPRLPDRTRLFRLLAHHRDWTRRFLAEPTLLGVADSYGIELIHPRREGRTAGQIGKKGKSNLRWIVGAKVCLVLNRFGLVCDWDTDTANVADKAFHPLIERFAPEQEAPEQEAPEQEAPEQEAPEQEAPEQEAPEQEAPEQAMLVLTDAGFHARAREGQPGDPANMKVCPRGTWNDRMVVETVHSMLTCVCRIKKVAHRAWGYLKARLAFCLAAFNLLVQWDGLAPDENGFVRLSLAQFSL